MNTTTAITATAATPIKPVFTCFADIKDIEKKEGTLYIIKPCKDSKGRSWASFHGIERPKLVKVSNDEFIVDTAKATYKISTDGFVPQFHHSEKLPGFPRFFSALKNYSRVDDLVTGTDPITGELIKFSVDFETDDWFDGQFRSGIRRNEFAKLLK